MLSGPELQSALSSLPAQFFEGVLYRATHLEALYGFHLARPYARPAPLYCLGPPTHGARFTPIGGAPALYQAGDPNTALLEANRGSALLLEPTVVFSAQVRLETVLDLTDDSVLAALQTDLVELTAPWRLRQKRGEAIATQILGAAVHDSGRFHAIRYQSAVAGGKTCYVIDCARMAPPSYVEVHDPAGNLLGRLP